MDTTIIIIVLAVILLICNAVAFLMYGADKKKAEKNAMRTPEATLILAAFLMGGIGAFAGMRHFRHKTNKLKFTLGVPVAIIVNLAVIALVVFFVF